MLALYNLRLQMWPQLRDMPPMNVRGFGASPLKVAPEKSNPGCCTSYQVFSKSAVTQEDLPCHSKFHTGHIQFESSQIMQYMIDNNFDDTP